MELIESEVYKGHTINVYPDEGVGNPLHEHDLMCTFVSFHSNYNLGNTKDFKTRGDFLEFWEENIRDLIVLPLYIYDHSGITISTGEFSCPWDSGQFGWVFYDRRNDKNEGYSNYTKAQIIKIMKDTVKYIDYYVSGQCYYIKIIDKFGEELDAFDYIGKMDDAIRDAKGTIDDTIAFDFNRSYTDLIQISNKIPLRLSPII